MLPYHNIWNAESCHYCISRNDLNDALKSCNDYAGIAEWQTVGYYTTGIGGSMVMYITGTYPHHTALTNFPNKLHSSLYGDYVPIYYKHQQKSITLQCVVVKCAVWHNTK